MTYTQQIISASQQGMEEIRFAASNADVYRRGKLADLRMFYNNLNATARHAAALEKELGIGIKADPELDSATRHGEVELLRDLGSRLYEGKPESASDHGEDQSGGTSEDVGSPTPTESSPVHVVLNLGSVFGNNNRQEEIAQCQSRHPSVWNGVEQSPKQ